jgi:serine/threonine-protein kinase HipA
VRRAIGVHLGDTPAFVGMLRYDQQGARESASFEYSATWLATPGAFAIDPNLPLVGGPQFHRKSRHGLAFHAVLADTEPDGWGRRVIVRDHAKRRRDGRSAGPLNGLDFLLAVDDVSRLGAVRLMDEHNVFQRAPEEGRRTTPPLVELGQLLAASRAVETQTETAADLAYLRGRGTSLGGLRPKCTVRDDDGCLSIGKFPSVTDSRAITKGEVLALKLARRAGVDAAEARLVDSDGSPVALVRRFDRARDGGRLAYVSAATMLGVDPADPGEHAYTELVDALRRHGSQPAAHIEELWRRVAFSILITNVDDHLMNHGFLHVGSGRWRLAPAFDVNPFPERVRELKTWISEDAGPEARVEGLLTVAPYRARRLRGRVRPRGARSGAQGESPVTNDRERQHRRPKAEAVTLQRS